MSEEFKGAREFCDRDCNNCEAIRNPQLSLLMNVLHKIFGGDVIGITNTVCPNMTCCSDCHIDDFCHWGNEGDVHCSDKDFDSACSIEREAERIANWFKETNMQGRVDGKTITLI